MKDLKIGEKAAASAIVDAGSTAKAVGSGSLDVFATPMMVVLLERAACNCLASCLEPGETSVGTRIDVRHTAASPLGAAITAAAIVEHVAGREVTFVVTASDEKGEIGRGTHTRFVVDAARFMAKTIVNSIEITRQV